MRVRHVGIKLTVSLLTGVFIALHILRPDIKIDLVTVGLLVVGTLPWLSSLIKSAELPGGWKIEFQELKEASDKVLGSATTSNAESRDEATSPGAPRNGASDPLFLTGDHDANLSLVALRIEIERRLRDLAQRHLLDARSSLGTVIKRLQGTGLLDAEAATGLTRLVNAGNQAAHGADVAPEVLGWAHSYGRQVIAVLDDLLSSY